MTADTEFINLLKNSADNCADNMEGADFKEFIVAEACMVMAVELLAKLGVKYDPMTGRENEIKENSTAAETKKDAADHNVETIPPPIET